MQSSDNNFGQNSVITLFCDENTTFNRNLLALLKHWDRRGKINILSSSLSAPFQTGAQHPLLNSSLLAVDENGVEWNGAEAVPIIFKNLPFGRLAAAMYILPGTMWVTKQLCEMETSANKAAS